MESCSHVVWEGSGEEVSSEFVTRPLFLGSEDECMAYSVGLYNLLIDITPDWKSLWVHVAPITDPDWSGALWCVDSGEIAWCELITVGNKNENKKSIVWGEVADIVESGDLVDGHPVSSDHVLWDECYMICEDGEISEMSAWGFPLSFVEGVCVGGLRSI